MKSDVKYEKACRCCLAEHGHMKNLAEDTFQVANGETVKLLEGFTKCSGINPDADKTYTNVCDSCETKLIISYEFRELCQKSNRILEEQLPVVKQEHYSDEDAPPRKKEKTAKKKKPGRPKKIADVPEIVYMKEEPFEELRVGQAESEESKPLDEDKVKEESAIVDSNSDRAINVSDNDDDFDGIAFDDRDFNDDDDEEEEDKTEAGSEKKDRASYQCFHCDIRFRTYTLLCRHKNAEHPVEQRPIKRTCPVCHTKTQHYTKHLKQQHKDFKPNKCQLCPAGFISHVKLQDHMRVHRAAKHLPFKCMSSDCGRVFGTSHRYRHHIKYDKHAGVDKYHCPRCGLDFSEFQPLHTHFKAEHDAQNIHNLFPCYNCKEIYKFRRYILEHKCEEPKKKTKKNDEKTNNHQLSMHPGQMFKCQQCGQEFENEDAFVCHRYSICLDDPKFICVTCGKECINQKRLTAHKRTHKDMTFICEDCGFQAIDRHTLTKHRITHSDERTAKCDICNAAFKNIYKLNTHKQIHGVRKYECAICAHKFKALSHLRRHIIATHLRPETTFHLECKFCGKKYARSRDLAGHIRTHTGELIKCHICDRTFKGSSTLQQHIHSVHEGVTFKCVYCNLTFNSKSGLKQHLFIHRGFMPFNCEFCSQKFVRKYRFVKHLTTHNVEYNEAIHGYQETDDINAIIAGGLVAPARVGISEIEKAEGYSLDYQI